MLTFLPTFIRLPLALLLVALNVLAHSAVLLALAVIKALVPIAGFRRLLSRALVAIAEQWIAVNGFLFALLTRTRWTASGAQALNREGWYLVLSNHQSWVDIPVLQRTFNRRIPFLKFFLKQQLKWMPVLGLAWWALDFPFMQRYSKETLEQHPELRGKDKEATRIACERFRDLPVSVMNFVEGTRFTPEKQARQASPFAHLLRPRAGGVAFVLETMGEILQSIVDVTIVYADGPPTVMDLLAGRVREVRIHVRELPIPADLIRGDYENDAPFRARFQDWINGLWAEKDALIASTLAVPAPAKPL
ncbi:MAG TPA: acyltransferase [Rudaea sp.]|jgi:1-acyl-sn-glycerol-3-phosphate acyltransferase|uniref:acyltransferase n=1 Tax=Rudaea sp. TaxID=2136325 RepID=UPI002F95E09B